MRGAMGSDRRAVWLIGFASLAIQLPFLELGFSPLDEGSMLAIAQALGQGEVLYLDKATFIGPLMYELMSVLLGVFGPQLIVGRLFQALVFSATAMTSYAILRSFTGMRWAAIAALSLCVLKPLALPMWTIPNYNQLGMLLALTAGLAALRFLASHDLRLLAAAGALAGMTAVTKLSLGAAIGLSVSAAVALDALRGTTAHGAGREITRRAIVLAATALVPVALTLLWYAAHGALGSLTDRTLLALGGVSTEMRVPLPSLWSWNASGLELFHLQYQYFPSPVFSWSLLRDVSLYKTWLGPGIELAVKLIYYGPLAATALAFVAMALELRSGQRLEAACGWLLVGGFSALSYLSTAHRLDFAHILNIAPAPLLACAIVLQRFSGRSWRLALPIGLLAGWIAAGTLASYVVFDAHDTPLETTHGRVVGTAQEVEDAEALLTFLAAEPSDARVLLLRTIPIFYFLADRPIPGPFDLYLPGYLLEGEDAVAARAIEAIDLVVYNPNKLIGIPKPITDFAPLTARALADRFEIVEILSPTAFVLRPRAAGRETRTTAVEIARHFDRVSTRAGADRVDATSWFMYPVVTTIVAGKDRSTCFTYPHAVLSGDVLSVRPMFEHVAWTRRFWPRAARRAQLSIHVTSRGESRVVYSTLAVAGLPGAPVEISLDAYAGETVGLRFCARRQPADRERKRVATIGWADPRILRK